MDKISISTKLSINDYIKVNFYIIYSRWTFKILTVLGLFFLLIFLFSFYNSLDSSGWIFLLSAIFELVVLPVMVYYNSRKNYNSNRRLNEPILYEIDNENISVTGESFNSSMSWDKIFKVTENKNWVLIWQNAKIVNVIPKRDFHGNDLDFIRHVVKSHKSIKNHLK